MPPKLTPKSPQKRGFAKGGRLAGPWPGVGGLIRHRAYWHQWSVANAEDFHYPSFLEYVL